MSRSSILQGEVDEIRRRLQLRLAPTTDDNDMIASDDMQSVVADARRLLALFDAVGCDNAALAALNVLRADVERRETLVTERENRVWGWRLIASSKEDVLAAEVAALEERERALQDRERALADIEFQLAQREAALEDRALQLNEALLKQTNRIRMDLSKIQAQ